MIVLDARVLRRVPGLRQLAATTVVLSVLRAAAIVTQAVALAHVLSAGFAGASVTALRPWLVVLGAAFAARAALGATQDLLSRRALVTARQVLRRELLDSAVDRGPGWLSERRAGELSTLLGSGVESLDGYFTTFVPQLAMATVVPLAVVVTVSATDWRSGVLLVVAVPLLPFFLALLGRHAQQETAHQWRELARLGGHFLDVVTGLPTLRVFGRADAQIQVLRRIVDDHRRATVTALRTAFLSAFVLELLATLSVAVIAVSVGFRLLDGGVSLERALLVLLLAPEAFLPLRALGSGFHTAMNGAAAASAALDVIDSPAPRTRGGRHQTHGCSISLRSVSVDLSSDREAALTDLDLQVGDGEQVCLRGPSGSGKSTVLSLALGLIAPTQGSVVLGGVEVSDADLEGWRSQLAWVPQRPHLFACSVRDNVRLGRPGATDAQVLVALRAAHAEEFVSALPRGEDTLLGERGEGLSVGQRRRLALARAFLKDAPLLVLDEPTADLDAESEAAVVAALAALCVGRTVLLATHRSGTTLPDVREVRLDHGRTGAVSA